VTIPIKDSKLYTRSSEEKFPIGLTLWLCPRNTQHAILTGAAVVQSV